ncbi:MAG: magnesium transporter protein [Candidatus Scalindua rubra]|uniref:Magnesium transporter MgtE n=1 Tax=Candidatus Scalindua rubra TaxID=1872076 RepID=A0A1E3XFI0_9BACT|nr:MAG: magnesium transporter protein [Candidatus Scalindua rubra]
MKWYKIFTPELKELIDSKNLKGLSLILREIHPADIADIIRELEPTERVIAFRVLDKTKIAEVFSLLDPEEEEELLRYFTEQRVKEILLEMSPDDRTQLLDELPASVVNKLLKLLPKEERDEANLLLNYPPQSAGRVMTTEYVDLRTEITVSEALEHIRKTGPDRETIYTCYAINEKRILCGVASLKDIILAKPDQKISEIMIENVFKINTTDDQEEAVKVIQKYDFLSLPVVDSENRLVGIITVDDILDIAEEEATEDFHKMAAIQLPEEKYFRSGFFKHLSGRVVWLFVLILAATISGKLLQKYSLALSSIIALAYFIPMLMGAGGNIGSQSSTLVVRALATGELTLRQWWKVLVRETCAGIVIGAVLGTTAFFIAIILLKNTMLGITVGISVTTVVAVGNLAGAATPLIFRYLRLDPAIVSAPLITTIIDVTGIIIYFEIAKRILNI